MNRPQIALKSEEHVRQIYDYYEQYRPPLLLSQFAWRAFDLIYNPDVMYMHGAEEQLNQLRTDKTPQIFAFNHLTDIHDQFITAATLRQIKPEASGQSRILAKDQLLRPPWRKGMGRLGDMLSGVPVYRRKDHGTDNGLVELSTECLQGCCAHLLKSRQDIVIYPEGTHNKSDPSIIGKVRTGAGEIACRAVALGSDVSVTTIGMGFDNKSKFRLPRHATVVVGNSFNVTPDDSVDSVTERIRDDLQTAVTIAFAK